MLQDWTHEPWALSQEEKKNTKLSQDYPFQVNPILEVSFYGNMSFFSF